MVTVLISCSTLICPLQKEKGISKKSLIDLDPLLLNPVIFPSSSIPIISTPPLAFAKATRCPAISLGLIPVSYTHLTLPTKA